MTDLHENMRGNRGGAECVGMPARPTDEVRRFLYALYEGKPDEAYVVAKASVRATRDWRIVSKNDGHRGNQ